MLWWSKVKLWCHHNRRYLVVASTILIAYLIGRKNTTAARAQLNSMRELYKKERQELETLDQKREQSKELARKNYSKAILMATKQMHESRDELQRKKAERVKDLLVLNEKNPDAINDILYKEFGIKSK